MAISSKVSFTRTSTTITINGPEGPSSVRPLPLWVSARSQSGAKWSYQAGNAARTFWTLRFSSLTDADWANLYSFFMSQAQGPTNSFNYTHTNGQTYTSCRFEDPELAAERISDNQWAVTVTLDVPSSITT